MKTKLLTIQLLKVGGTPILVELSKSFNSVIHTGTTQGAWSRRVLILFFNKGYKSLLKNYRPILLLSHVYNLFSKVITNRHAQKLHNCQPVEQAGFRRGFITVDHIHIKANYSENRGVHPASLPSVCELRESPRHHRNLGYI